FGGRGIFGELEWEIESRARAAGVILVLTVPTAGSARILTGRLGWQPLPSLRVWVRPWPRRVQASRVPRLDDAYLDWRFAEAPREYALYADGTLVGRRGRFSFVARGRADAAGPSLRPRPVPAPEAFPRAGEAP